MHPGHLLLVALVLAGVVLGALALAWAWRTASPGTHESVLAEFVRRDRQDPEAARRWLRDRLRPADAEPESGGSESSRAT